MFEDPRLRDAEFGNECPRGHLPEPFVMEKRSYGVCYNSGEECLTVVMINGADSFLSAGGGCRRSRSELRLRVRWRFEVSEMHIVIYALVEASTHNDALATGKTVFDRLIGADPHASAVFDYYVTFDENDTTVASKARWGDLPTAAPIDSDDGQDLVGRGWEATKEEFERNLERVKEALDELSDGEIMRDEDLARHAFHQVGACDGPTIFLYNEYANGIRHREQLDRILEESEELWIVPADVHF